MTINNLKRATRAKFAEKGVADGDNAILEMLMEHAFSFSRNFILQEPGYEIDENSEGYLTYMHDLELLLNDVPIQHIVGYADFCKLKYKVNENVLIPRQETEILVKIALHFLKNSQSKTPMVADVCCGSGAIGIAVKNYWPSAKVVMSDISPLALSVATENADAILGSSKSVTFLQGSYLEPLIKLGKKYDCFLSNPPYIKTEDLDSLPANVKGHEPSLALDGGVLGVDPYDIMIPELHKILNIGALVCFEIGETQGEYIKNLMIANGFSEVAVVKDLCECDRFVCGKYLSRKLDINANDPVSKLPGIGPKSSEAFHTMGVYSVRDLATFYPKEYEDRTKIWSLRDGYNELLTSGMSHKHTYKLKIKAIHEYGNRFKRVIVATCSDGSMDIRISFFNASYVKSQLFPLVTYYFFGQISEQENQGYRSPQIINPNFIDAENPKAKDFLSIFPVYRTRSSVKRETIRKAVAVAVDTVVCENSADLPAEIINKYEILPISSAIRSVHFPKTIDEVEKAVRRLAFDELLSLTLKVGLLKASRATHDGNGIPFEIFDDSSLLSLLPYTLTEGQSNTIAKIKDLMSSKTPMNLLVIGDVGSGKTVIALSAIYQALLNGKQSALMVPSTVLADQHYKKLKPLLNKLGFETELLHSGVSAKERKRIAERVKNDDNILVIGTHALIQENVAFSHLGLVVTDEQHRFGVNQRRSLIGNYENTPHVLSLSATPIPRTLALIIYGDMDICYLKEKPSGRKPIETILVESPKRRQVYKDALNAIRNGHQVFMVHSCIEDPEDELDLEEEDAGYIKKLKSCISNYNDLKETVFKTCKCGLLHGKMKNDEKNQVMTAFANGEIDILFSTTVIEVGIDVPNATMMIIENAERFGLSQLHQFRGRVGRGEENSYCFLISDKAFDNERLKVLAESSDGFKIAEEDLNLRGPGELFGTEQSGMPLFKLANPLMDKDLLDKAVSCSAEIIALANGGNAEMIQYIDALATQAENIVL